MYKSNFICLKNGDYLKKEDIDVNSIVDEYKMSMGGCFFSKVQPDKDDKESEQSLIENVIENHLFEVNKLLDAYDELSADKKRELFFKVVVSLINSTKK